MKQKFHSVKFLNLEAILYMYTPQQLARDGIFSLAQQKSYSPAMWTICIYSICDRRIYYIQRRVYIMRRKVE